MVADVWPQRLDRRHAHVRPVLLPTPPLDADEREWARTGALSATSVLWPSVVDVTRDPMEGSLRRMSWNVPVWNAGVDEDQLVLGFLRKHVNFWYDIVLKGWDTLVLYLRDGVDLHDLLPRKHRGRSSNCPYDVNQFPGAVF